MKIGEPLYAIVDPETGRILGDGECAAIFELDKEELDLVRRYYARPNAQVRRVKIIYLESEPQ